MSIRLLGSLLVAAGILFLPAVSFAQVGVSVQIGPPELPVYDQPICPGDGYIWTPGYWAWDGDYYWVPGTWVLPPEVGFLWTPGYWAWGGAGFIFNDGYWGLDVGFYGGINYGFGYFGHGYEGGRWDNGHFFYNTAVNRVDERTIHNVYNTRVNDPGIRVSFNGGNGGINARASAQEEGRPRQMLLGPWPARGPTYAVCPQHDPQQRASTNRGKPPVTATARPVTANHPKELPPAKVSAPNTGDAKVDQKYQQQQNTVVARNRTRSGNSSSSRSRTSNISN